MNFDILACILPALFFSFCFEEHAPSVLKNFSYCFEEHAPSVLDQFWSVLCTHVLLRCIAKYWFLDTYNLLSD